MHRYPSETLLMRLILAGVLILCLRESAAQACVCSGQFPLQYPSDGQTDVPVDARIWIGLGPQPSNGRHRQIKGERPPLVVTSATHGPIQGSETLISVGPADRASRLVRVFSPAEPLRPGTTYRVRVDEGDEWTFTTRSSEQTSAAPAVPHISQLSIIAQDYRSSCGANLSASFHMEQIPGLALLAPDDETRLFDAPALSGRVRELTTDNEIYLGALACIPHWPGAELGETIRFRYGVLDFSGRFSGWSEPVSVTFPDRYRSWKEDHRLEWMLGSVRRMIFLEEGLLAVFVLVFVGSWGGAIICGVLIWKRRRRSTSARE